ncbi:hypothetical protein [Pseudomonas sp. TMW 2.1634]|uniref:hypothetical protein n=1 Tax=Pseudomonas sp. TMW 2.1634 TaxID=1886807 RepID=UPI0013C3F470|nr:hypothetical protein [Pseudomonas sp. TMW 2.1634]
MHTFAVDKINGGNIQVLIEGQVQGGRRARVCACPYSSLVPRALLQICGFDPLDKNFYMSFDEANSLKKIDQNQ